MESSDIEDLRCHAGQKPRNGLRHDQSDVQPENLDSQMPEQIFVYVKTWGCTHNRADSEVMSGLLVKNGYMIGDADHSSVWLLNSCTAKTPSEDKFIHYVSEGKRLKKKVVLAGCVTEADTDTFAKDPHVSIVGVDYVDRIVEVVDEAVKGNKVVLAGVGQLPSLQLPRVRHNEFIEIIPVSSGCLNHCTYCKTKLARGELRSYDPAAIVQRCKQVFAENVKELWLTSEDLGAYGIDIGTDIIALVDMILNVTPPGCIIRLGMTNPPYMHKHVNGLVRVLSDPRVYAFLHIPVQSGSDAVLADMRREYCVDDFVQLVQQVQSRVPGGVHIATDVICGYPTETEEDFDRTLALVERFHFPSVYINQFYQRSGTLAAMLPQLPTRVKRARTRKMTALFKSYQTFDHLKGTVQYCLFTEVARDGYHLVGHTKRYEQVLVKPCHSVQLGHWAYVKVTRCGKYSMEAEPVRELGWPLIRTFSIILSAILISRIGLYLLRK